jgi:hypothetical protein
MAQGFDSFQDQLTFGCLNVCVMKEDAGEAVEELVSTAERIWSFVNRTLRREMT